MSPMRDPWLLRLFTRLHNERGLDFTQYKRASVERRIQARLMRLSLKSYAAYDQYLNEHPNEMSLLLDSMSINVTEFFRNPEAFEAIYEKVLPKILESKDEDKARSIRLWSCGCSSGDEPYSLAIMMLDILGEERSHYRVSVSGTDIDEGILRDAEEGVYSADRLKSLEDSFIRRYFDRINANKFRIQDEVREIVQFRQHDIVLGKPMMKMDLILCRNLLIYFNCELQEEILLKFYNCLNPGGYLVLGMSESLSGTAINHFEHVDNRLRIYRHPKNPQWQFKTEHNLSQSEIDRIVREHSGR